VQFFDPVSIRPALFRVTSNQWPLGRVHRRRGVRHTAVFSVVCFVFVFARFTGRKPKLAGRRHRSNQESTHRDSAMSRRFRPARWSIGHGLLHAPCCPDNHARERTSPQRHVRRGRNAVESSKKRKATIQRISADRDGRAETPHSDAAARWAESLFLPLRRSLKRQTRAKKSRLIRN